MGTVTCIRIRNRKKETLIEASIKIDRLLKP